MKVEITIEFDNVIKVASNKYGTFYLTSEGWHINGNKKKFIENIKKDLHSIDALAKEMAEYIIDVINNCKEV